MLPRLGHLCFTILVFAGSARFVQSECNLGPMNQHTVTASSERNDHTASDVFSDKGWCAKTDKNNEWVEVEFPNGFGAKGFTIGSTNIDSSSYPKSVLVQYVPSFATSSPSIQNFPIGSEQSLIIHQNSTGTNTNNINVGFAVKKLRFTLQSYSGRACMNLTVTGCEISDLCIPSCHNGGVCKIENVCACGDGFHGSLCENKACSPASLGLFDGRVPQKDIFVSSEDPSYPKSQIGFDPNNTNANTGWCAADNDKSPFVEIHFDEPKDISTFNFFYVNIPLYTSTYMRLFELQYIAPTDSARIFRTYADNVDSLNGTHAISVTLLTPVITDAVRIVARDVEGKACFKLEIVGCDPKYLCQAGWCMNGGSCVGENICKCPSGFLGDRCNKTKNDIDTPPIEFLNITNSQLITTAFTFSVTGSVTIKKVNNANVVVINGANSNIRLDNGTGTGCLNNIDHCQTGYTFSLEIKFGSLVDNTYIISSGGDLPDHKGLALFYTQQTLTYVVTTSTQTWRLTVQYVPVMNIWHKFEITWNTNLGIGLFLDGKLLGTHGRPEPTTATQTAQVCIGCNPGQTSNVVVNMQILQIHTWIVSRTELVNAGIVCAPIVTTMRTATPKPTTTASTPKATTKTTTAVPTTATTDLPTTTTTDLPTTTTDLPTTTTDLPATTTTDLPTTTTTDLRPTTTTTDLFPTTTTTYLPTTTNVPTTTITTDLPATTKTTKLPTTTTVIPTTTTDIETTSAAHITTRPIATTTQLKTTTTESVTTATDASSSNVSTTTTAALTAKTTDTPTTEYTVTTSNTGPPATQKTSTTAQPVTTDKVTVTSLATTTTNGPTSSTPTTTQMETDTSTTLSKTTKTSAVHTTTKATPSTSDTTTEIPTTTTIVVPISSMAPASSSTPTAISTNSTGTKVTPTPEKRNTTISSRPTPTTATTPEHTTGYSTTLYTKSVTPSQTTANPGYQIYNMTITGIVGNLLITPTFNFTVHGNPKLELENNSQTALVLNCSQNQYVELIDNGIPCLQDLETCDNGFTLNLEVQFTKIELHEKTYIVSSGGDEASYNGMALYLHSNLLTYGVKKGMKHWAVSKNVKNIIEINKWHKFEISWAETTGLLVLVDGYDIISTSEWTPGPGAPQSNAVLIGKSPDKNYTSCMKVRDLYTWTTQREVLVKDGILPGPKLPEIPMINPTGPSDLTPYDLTFIRINENQIVYTTDFIFQGHGNPQLPPNGDSVLTLNGFNDQYLTLLNKSVTCLDLIETCRHGFSIEISAFVVQSINGKMYFFSSLNNSTTGGVYLYYENGYLHYGFKFENKVWSDSVKYSILDYRWHSFILSWSSKEGILLLENFKLLSQSTTSTLQEINLMTVGDFKIGRGDVLQQSIFQVNHLRIWPYSFHFLIEHKIYTTVANFSTPPSSSPSSITTTTITTVTPLSSTTPSPQIKLTTQTIHLANQTSQIIFPNSTFLGHIGNVVKTASYNLTMHGSVTFVQNASGENMIHVDASKGGYLHIKESNLHCLANVQNCHNAFAVHLDINFVTLDNTTKVYLISKPPSQNGLGVSLYYQSSQIFFSIIEMKEQRRWESSIPFKLNVTSWNSVQLKWSVESGVSLYINGVLLKSETAFTTVHNINITTSAPLTIGKTLNINTNTSVVFYVKGIAIGQPDPSVIPTTETAALTTNVTPSTQTTATATTKPLSSPATIPQTQTTKQTTPQTPQFTLTNVTLIGHIGNVITTSSYNLTMHGSVTFVQNNSGENMIHVDASKGGYLHIKESNLHCLANVQNCHNAFAVHLDINFVTLDNETKVYLISKPPSQNGLGVSLYYQSSQIFFSIIEVKEQRRWESSIPFKLNVTSWNSVQLKWSVESGVSLYINGVLLKSETAFTTVHNINITTSAPLTIGKTLNINTNTSVVFYVKGIAIGQPDPSVIPLTETAALTINVTPTTQTTATATTKSLSSLATKPQTQTTKQTTPQTPQFTLTNVTLIGHIGNVITTSSYNLTMHGAVTFVQNKSRGNMIQIDASKGGFLHIKESNLQCLANVQNCHNAFAVHLDINFVTLDNTTKVYLISKPPSQNGLGVSLYYLSSQIFFSIIEVKEQRRWESSIPFKLNVTSWNSVQLKWSVESGVSLYINGVLLKSETGFTTVHNINITTSAPLTIGKTLNINTNTSVVFYVKGIAIGQPDSSVIPLTESAALTINVTPTTQTTATSTTKSLSSLATKPQTQTTKQTTPQTPQFTLTNVTLIGHIGNVITTSSYNLTMHGAVTFVQNKSRENMIQIDASKGGFLHIKESNLQCLANVQNCHNAFAVHLDINFVTLDNTTQVYLISKPPSQNGLGVSLYYQSSQIFFSIIEVKEQRRWVSSIPFKLNVTSWNSVQLKWSVESGVSLYINGVLLKSETTFSIVHNINITTPAPLTIGKASVSNITTSVVFYVKGIAIGQPGTSALQTTKTVAMTTKEPSTTTLTPHTQAILSTSSLTATASLPSTKTLSPSLSLSSAKTTMAKSEATTTPAETTSSLPLSSPTTRTITAAKSVTPTAVGTSSALPSFAQTTVILVPQTKTMSPTSDAPLLSSVSYTTSRNSHTSGTTAPTPIPVSNNTIRFAHMTINGNTIHADKYTLTAHGTREVVQGENGDKVLKINSTNKSYLEVDTANITCIKSLNGCNQGLTVILNLNFITIQNNTITYLVSNVLNSSHGVEFYLYYVNSNLYFGFKVGSKLWSTKLEYLLKRNTWLSIQLSFTEKHGVGLFVNNKLIRYVSEGTSTHYFPYIPYYGMTIGHSQNTSSSTFLIGGLQISETVNQHYQALTPQTISFTNVTLGNADHKLFTVHGHVNIVKSSPSECVITINSSTGSYLEISTGSVICAQSLSSCSNGFMITLDLSIVSVNDSHQFYLFSNIKPDGSYYLYYRNNVFFFGVTYGSFIWTSSVAYKVQLGIWNTYALSWSQHSGCGLYINGYLIGNITNRSELNTSSHQGPFTIGTGSGESSAVYLIKELQIWPLPYESLLHYGIVSQAVATSPTSSVVTVKTTQPTGHISPDTALSTASEVVHEYSTTATPIDIPVTSIVITPTTKSHTGMLTSQSASITKPHTSVSTSLSTSTTEPRSSVSASISTSTHTPAIVQNIGFLNITGNKLHTTFQTFTVHGKPVIVEGHSGQNAVQLNASTGAFIELDSKNITCKDLTKCNSGMSVGVDLNIVNIQQNHTLYIMTKSDNSTKGISYYVYYLNGKIYFGTKLANETWSTSIDYHLTSQTWHTIEISISRVYSSIGLLIDNQLVKYVSKENSTNAFPNIPTTGLTIGQTTHYDFTTTVMIGGIQFWPSASQVMEHGISIQLGISTAKTTPVPATAKPTTAALTTSTITTSTTTPTTTTIPTTTKKPIPTFHWNLTTIPTTNVIIGPVFNLTVHGTPSTTNAGVVLRNTTDFIDIGAIQCLLNPLKCVHGVTVQFTVTFVKVTENTYILTSGGELPNGVGIAVIYRYGQYQFVVSTSTHAWYAICGKDILKPNTVHVIMLSWQMNGGLEIIVDNVQVAMVTTSVIHTVSTTTATIVHIGKQPSTTIKYEYIIQTVSVWYAHVDILVVENLCPKPERPEKPTTPKPTVTPKSTPKPTSSAPTTFTGIVTSKPPQCPAGCVSIVTNLGNSSNAPSIVPNGQTTSKPATPKPTTTQKPTTPKPTTQKPTTPKPTTPPTTTPTTRPTTTERGAPNYNTTVTITSTVTHNGKDANLVCAFRPSSAGIVMTVALLIDGNRVLVQTVQGTAGIAMFSVAQVNKNLYMKRIKCSLVANYVGSSHSTHVFVSNTYIPKLTITPSTITVTEGRPGKPVTVQSTAPPHLYCCTGCKGQCQVHVVGTFVYNRRDFRCSSQNYVSQAVIESAKPPHYNKEICGFALTISNWHDHNSILVKALLDNRRDGTQKRELKVVMHVYNQPANAQITERPVTHTASPHVQVTILDKYESPYTCKSINDPHMLTFDGAHFNNMEQGQFVMFKHKDLPFEVRSWYEKCSKRSHATCNCGVAVKSGDDIISVIGCHTVTSNHHPHGQGHGIGLIFQQLFGNHGHGHGNSNEFAKTPMTIQIYKNGELTPGTFIRRYGCGQKYEIELPTGMVITVQQSYKPFINIWIKASSYDKGLSSGLCGNYDGHQNEWSGNKGIATYINNNRAPTGNFFTGVGQSALTTTSMYCSCVENKGSVCSAGLGVMQCSTSRYDVTRLLLRQAQTPILGSNRQKRQATDPENAPTVTPDSTNITSEIATSQCTEYIMNNTVTESCQPILTTNLSQQIINCVEDYQATESFAFASSALSDIVVDCVESANAIIANNDTEDNTTNVDIPIPDNLDEILTKACVEDCGANGECQRGVCVCNDGYSGVTCDISRDTTPTVSSVPFLCDIANTLDCMGAVVYGENFVNSSTLTCHYEYIEVSETVQTTKETATVTAQFITLNQVICQVPELRSAKIRVSNDGQTMSERASPHVVFDSGCYDCSVTNNTDYTPVCTRKENNCVINGNCYQDGNTKPGDVCRMCNPAVNDTVWSINLDKTECTATPLASTTSNTDDEKKVIALAVVSAVLAAILLILITYIVKSRSSSSSKKEFGQYQISAPESKLHRDEVFQSRNNPIYEEIEKL